MGFISRPDFYGGKSELLTARDWFDNNMADLRRDRSIWTMRICVLAALEGVPLYTKFGFKIVGRVQTPGGAITSMLRSSNEMLGKPIGETIVLLENVYAS